MRAVVCTQLGLEHLVVEERPAPPCGVGMMRVRVAAAGVNFVDALLVAGRYQVKPPLPFVPGSEVAGVVTEVGDGPAAVRPGDRVVAMVGFGGFADEVVVPAAAAVPVPGALTDGQASTFLQSYMTAWFALRERARAEAGQSLLVLGAGSGVGLAAVDVGRFLGLRVLAAASTAEKRARAERSGAAATIDPSAGDLKVRARELSGGGVDVVLDPVGGDLAEQGLRALGEDGRLLVVGFASGDIPRLPANHVLLRNRRVVGVDWGGWLPGHPAENRRLLDQVLAAIAGGGLHPVEPVTYPLADAARALGDVAGRRVTGKVALVP